MREEKNFFDGVKSWLLFYKASPELASESMGRGNLLITMTSKRMMAGRVVPRVMYHPSTGPQTWLVVIDALAIELPSQLDPVPVATWEVVETNERQGPSVQFWESFLKALTIPMKTKKAMRTEITMIAARTTAIRRVMVIPAAKMSLLRMRSKKKENKRVKRTNPVRRAIKTKAWEVLTMLRTLEESA